MAGKPIDPKKLAELDKLILAGEKKIPTLKAEAQKEKAEILLREKGIKDLEKA